MDLIIRNFGDAIRELFWGHVSSISFKVNGKWYSFTDQTIELDKDKLSLAIAVRHDNAESVSHMHYYADIDAIANTITFCGNGSRPLPDHIERELFCITCTHFYRECKEECPSIF